MTIFPKETRGLRVQTRADRSSLELGVSESLAKDGGGLPYLAVFFPTLFTSRRAPHAYPIRARRHPNDERCVENAGVDLDQWPGGSARRTSARVSLRDRSEPTKRRARARVGESEGRSPDGSAKANERASEPTRSERADEAASESACWGVRGAKPRRLSEGERARE